MGICPSALMMYCRRYWDRGMVALVTTANPARCLGQLVNKLLLKHRLLWLCVNRD